MQSAASMCPSEHVRGDRVWVGLQRRLREDLVQIRRVKRVAVRSTALQAAQAGQLWRCSARVVRHLVEVHADGLGGRDEHGAASISLGIVKTGRDRQRWHGDEADALDDGTNIA